MALNPIRTPSSAQPGLTRLYLRDEELVAGIAAFFDVEARLKAAGDAARAAENLTWAQVRALLALAQAPDTVMGLAFRLSVTKQALTRTLEELEARGLVARTADPRDRRRRQTSLTAAGSQLLMSLTAPMRQTLAAAYRAAGGEAVAGCDRVVAALVRLPAQAGGAGS